jgi:RND superfamily putative drug exporter
MSIFLVPSLTALLGTKAWWPRKLKVRRDAAPSVEDERVTQPVG